SCGSSPRLRAKVMKHFDDVAIYSMPWRSAILAGWRPWREAVMDTMERRCFLKLTLGLAVVTAVGGITAPAVAMPVAPIDPPRLDPEVTPEPAIASQDDIDVTKAEPVQWWRRRRRRRRLFFRRRRLFLRRRRRRRRYWY